MNDFTSLEKTIVRELSCRLCLCTDVSKLKPLNAEIKRKIKKLFDFTVSVAAVFLFVKCLKLHVWYRPYSSNVTGFRYALMTAYQKQYATIVYSK